MFERVMECFLIFARSDKGIAEATLSILPQYSEAGCAWLNSFPTRGLTESRMQCRFAAYFGTQSYSTWVALADSRAAGTKVLSTFPKHKSGTKCIEFMACCINGIQGPRVETTATDLCLVPIQCQPSRCLSYGDIIRLAVGPAIALRRSHFGDDGFG